LLLAMLWFASALVDDTLTAYPTLPSTADASTVIVTLHSMSRFPGFDTGLDIGRIRCGAVTHDYQKSIFKSTSCERLAPIEDNRN
jgi:hypothetical protein